MNIQPIINQTFYTYINQNQPLDYDELLEYFHNQYPNKAQATIEQHILTLLQYGYIQLDEDTNIVTTNRLNPI